MYNQMISDKNLLLSSSSSQALSNTIMGLQQLVMKPVRVIIEACCRRNCHVCGGCLTLAVGWFRHVLVWAKYANLHKDHVLLPDFLKNYALMVKNPKKTLDSYCEIYEHGNSLQGHCYRVAHLKGKFLGFSCNAYCCYVIL